MKPLRFLTTCLLLCAFALFISGCNKQVDETPVLESITLNQTELAMGVGDTYTLTATVSPAEAEVTLEWISANPDVVSVDTDGNLTAIAAGTTTVTVRSGEISASCNVTVSEEAPVVESIKVTPETAEVLINGTFQLTAEVTPADAAVEVKWRSSNEDIATVSEDGTVTGIAAGNVIVMAEAGGLTADCMVSVVGAPVESITLDNHELEMVEGDVITLHAEVMPENADNTTITWSSSDESIVTVSGAGTVTALRGGEAVITAKAGNVSDECHVTVEALPLAVGNFYYADGTWSSRYDSNRECIGIVFYVGDITATDKALAREHPGCTHGLVVSLFEAESGSYWQQNYVAYNNTVGSWVEANVTDYETITTDTLMGSNLNIPMGYNNSKAIEAFNAAPENSQWKVEAMEYVISYREDYPAPESSSDWYLGSAKEMSMLATGEYEGNIWDIRDPSSPVDVIETVNESIIQVPGACRVGTMGLDLSSPQVQFYWSSTELDKEYSFCMTAYNGQMPKAYKSEGGFRLFTVRPILAF